MGRIKIEELPKEMKVSKDDMRKIRGGFGIRGGFNPRYTTRLAGPSTFGSLRNFGRIGAHRKIEEPFGGLDS